MTLPPHGHLVSLICNLVQLVFTWKTSCCYIISINFTPKTSHSCLKEWYTRFSRHLLFFLGRFFLYILRVWFIYIYLYTYRYIFLLVCVFPIGILLPGGVLGPSSGHQEFTATIHLFSRNSPADVPRRRDLSVLKQTIRKWCKHPLNNQADVEEMVKFVKHASKKSLI